MGRRGFLADMVRCLPQGLISRGWGFLAEQEHPRWFADAFKKIFVRLSGIEMDEATHGIESYSSLAKLFVRELQPGCRPLSEGMQDLVSPVDGKVGALGKVLKGEAFQVKGKHYSVAELLGISAQEAEIYEGGAFATLYLAPHNYHRIHAPAAGKIHEARLIPGGLFPVFPDALDRIDRLFARNERVISFLDTPHGRIAVVKVGATLVGRISLAYDPKVSTNVRGQTRQHLRYDLGIDVAAGDQLGAFHLGSTVVLIGEKNAWQPDAWALGSVVRMGMRFGSLGMGAMLLDAQDALLEG